MAESGKVNLPEETNPCACTKFSRLELRSTDSTTPSRELTKITTYCKLLVLNSLQPIKNKAAFPTIKKETQPGANKQKKITKSSSYRKREVKTESV